MTSDTSQIFYNARDVEEQLPAVIKAITIDDQARIQLKEQLDNWFAAESGGSEELLQAQQRLAKLEHMEKNLQRLVIEDQISLEDFKEHRARIQSERVDLKTSVDAMTSRQGLVKADFEIALQLASQLDFLFTKGDNDERRLLCETVFRRIRVRDRKIVQVELNSPFTLIASRGDGSGSFLNGQPVWKHSELIFEKKQLIPVLQQLLASYSKP